MTDYYRATQLWMGGVGVALLVVGVLGFFENPIAYEENALFITGTVHNYLHLATGAFALVVAVALRGTNLAWGAIVFGIAYGGLLLGTLLSPDLFGLLEMPVNVGDHVLHVVLSGVSIALGALALQQERVVAR